MPLPGRGLLVEVCEAHNNPKERLRDRRIWMIDIRDERQPVMISSFPTPKPLAKWGVDSFYDLGERFGHPPPSFVLELMDRVARSALVPDGATYPRQFRPPPRAQAAGQLGEQQGLPAAGTHRLRQPRPAVTAEPAYETVGRRSAAEETLLGEQPALQPGEPRHGLP